MKLILEGFDYLGLTVKSLDASIAFYSDLLDFDEVRRFDTEKSVILELEGVRIKITEQEGFNQVESNNTLYLSFSMDMDDFTDALKEIESRGLKILSGPHAEEGGESIFITDPDGYRIKLAYQD